MNNVRSSILKGLLQGFKDALKYPLAKEFGSRCGELICLLRQIGVMTKVFDELKLYPLPENHLAMHSSVDKYLADLKSQDERYSAWLPTKCQKTNPTVNSSSGISRAVIGSCLGNCGITHIAKAVLQSHAHKIILKEMLAVSVVQFSPLMLLICCRRRSSELFACLSCLFSTSITIFQAPDDDHIEIEDQPYIMMSPSKQSWSIRLH
jgi:hypothetical protein